MSQLPATRAINATSTEDEAVEQQAGEEGPFDLPQAAHQKQHGKRVDKL